jgi:hypothetical protein
MVDMKMWTYENWGGRFLRFSSDEWFRHTLVIPNPFKVNSVDEEGHKYRPAIVFVVAPWWACRHIFSDWYREDARHARRQAQADLLALAEMRSQHYEQWLVTHVGEEYFAQQEIDAAWETYFELFDKHDEALKGV